ncbi:heat shock protein DnaJ domain protein [Stanieria cyanosphaera PCC 7437]|uniref:Heat shock protein DnaJ domain protein n=1 Tax=Stanieria cyanosphaera (strain ATCC 29371 / PCC 7437) TaxID=111780 RepID=K9XQT6_STAC7|nr:J domain-containing protein [Stanieria cyanosphaera]AFZ34449.1 heat shock protein DnaJ domain protein [Stanieria cyanosphaera PCC 7437]
MNLVDAIAKLQSQLQQIQVKEEQNQQEQATINQTIQELEQTIQQQYQRQSELDREAIELYRQAEEIKVKLAKLAKIAAFSQQFQVLKAECQDNQELLQTLYSALPIPLAQDTLTGVFKDHNFSEQKTFVEQQQTEELIFNLASDQHNSEDSFLTIEKIKAALPHAESIYKQMVVRYLDQYQTYQNFIIDELDLIWCSLAFVAFGRSSYRKLSLKHHPDLDGSQRAMQLINAAWEISQDYLTHSNDTVKN